MRDEEQYFVQLATFTHNKWPLAVLFSLNICMQVYFFFASYYKSIIMTMRWQQEHSMSQYIPSLNTYISHTSFGMIFIVLVSKKTFVFSQTLRTHFTKIKRLKLSFRIMSLKIKISSSHFQKYIKNNDDFSYIWKTVSWYHSIYYSLNEVSILNNV